MDKKEKKFNIYSLRKAEINNVTLIAHEKDIINMNDSEQNIVLKEIITDQLKEIESDDKIIEETNKQISEIERDMSDLTDIMKCVQGTIVTDGQKIETIEKHIENADQTILETLPILNEVITTIADINDKYTTLKVIGGAVIGGVLFGGVGSLFGIVPGLVFTGVGSGSGVMIGYLSKYIN